PVAQRVDVDVELLRAALPGAGGVEEGAEGGHEVAAVCGVVALDDPDQALAVEAPHVVGDGGQEELVGGEGAGVGGAYGAGSEGRDPEGVAGLVQGAAQAGRARGGLPRADGGVAVREERRE